MGDKVSVALSLILEIIPLINVLLVDDHELVRAGIRRILEDIKGIKVVGEASCGEDAVKWCRANAVDVVLMDMSMPGIGGLVVTRRICQMAQFAFHAELRAGGEFHHRPGLAHVFLQGKSRSINH